MSYPNVKQQYLMSNRQIRSQHTEALWQNHRDLRISVGFRLAVQKSRMKKSLRILQSGGKSYRAHGHGKQKPWHEHGFQHLLPVWRPPFIGWMILTLPSSPPVTYRNVPNNPEVSIFCKIVSKRKDNLPIVSIVSLSNTFESVVSRIGNYTVRRCRCFGFWSLIRIPSITFDYSPMKEDLEPLGIMVATKTQKCIVSHY